MRFLGKKVRDKVSGFEGIATAETMWLNGCVRVIVQPGTDKDGKKVDAESFDDVQLEVMGEGPVPFKMPDAPASIPEPERKRGWFSRSGGDRPSAKRAPDPSR